jgi:protein-disulfide isomerase
MKLALCANEQGKFWDAHEIFFSNQDKMNDNATLESLMGNITGIDAAKLTECYDAKKYDNALQEDIAAGQAAGMQGTPSFYIGNEESGYVKVTGAQSYTTMKQVIDAALA